MSMLTRRVAARPLFGMHPAIILAALDMLGLLIAALLAQALWDATMAYWISEALNKQDRGLVVHLNGGFHTEQRLGTVEHLMKYRPGAKAVVVTIRYDDDFQNFNKEKYTGLGDFVVLTDGKQPRSKR